MAKKKKPPTLVEIIQANPGAVVRIDNDWWGMYRDAVEGDDEYVAPEDIAAEDEEDFMQEQVELATSDTHGEYRGHVYGRGVLDALAEIVGIYIEDV